MAQPKLQNVIIVVTDGYTQAIANLTVPEPGAKRLADLIGGIAHMTDPEQIKQALKLGMAQIDTVTVNKPTPPVDPPAGPPLVQVYEDDLIAIAEGRKVVLLNDGIPVIEDVQKAADGDLGPLGGEKNSQSGGSSADDQTDQTTKDDGSAAGEKHGEGGPAGT